jgi:hypothetical protein
MCAQLQVVLWIWCLKLINTMVHYIIFIVCFVYCVIDNWMPVATHGHEPSKRLGWWGKITPQVPHSLWRLIYALEIKRGNVLFSVLQSWACHPTNKYDEAAKGGLALGQGTSGRLDACFSFGPPPPAPPSSALGLLLLLLLLLLPSVATW